MQQIDILFDMETNDPDDVMTLCILSAHPNVNLRAVTVMPGTDEQVGLVHRVLELTDHPEIPVGSYAIGYEKPCVSGFHNKWFGKWEDKTPDGEGYQIIKETVGNIYKDIYSKDHDNPREKYLQILSCK